MKSDEILQYCLDNLEGTVLVSSWGEKGIFFNPGNLLKRGVYVLTVKEKDGDNDKSSKLDRENVYRVNIGIRKDTFIKLFGKIPERPGEILPHPVYAWMGWICVLNPTEQLFEELKLHIQESYEYAKEKFKKRKR